MKRNAILRRKARRFRNPSPDEGRPINFEDALRVAKQVMKQTPGPSAVCGGLAMQLYGFTRATKDVDVVAWNLPEDFGTARKRLTFGGVSYNFRVRSNDVPVDVIVRDDREKALYESAASEGRVIQGVRVVSPEFLVVIKFMAARPKDLLDVMYLLRKNLFRKKDAMRVIKNAFPGQSFLIDDFEALLEELSWEMSREKPKYL